uniref:Farnesoic acid O-methyl transferase domain-containing protein n=1 Tax=Glossina morsitans morsitans TaxID=37546 RepID=A0A1B0G458_GLOMM
MPLEINTPNKLEYQFHPVFGSLFTFKVRCANDAHLTLATNPVEENPTYEVFIGGWSNSKSVIRKNRQKPDVAAAITPCIVDANEFRGFWIQWSNNIISVGREGEAVAFLSYEAQDLFPINFIGICTAWGASGTWLIDEMPAPVPSRITRAPLAVPRVPVIKEVNTPDKLEYQFHPVSGNVFTFKVRSPNDAHLALTSNPVEEDPMYEVFIGGWSNSKSVIRKNRQKPDVAEADTPGILDGGEFRGFWIRWYDNVITVGREGEAAAFLSYDAPDLFPINFVGVCTGWGANGTWLLEESTAPSAPSEPAMGFAPPTSGGGPGCWVPAANGEIPPTSMEGGFDGSEQLYIARAKHEGDLIPGKLHPSHGVCYVAFGGGEHGHNEYEVLCAGGGQWVPVQDGNIPPNAVPGGETAEGEPLFIGRATHDGTVTVGKVQPSHGCCYIPYGGEEVAYKDFEVYVAM